MKVKKIRLRQFRRFTDLTIDLGEQPKKIIALLGVNGSGKSVIIDAFIEKQSILMRKQSSLPNKYSSKSEYSSDPAGDELTWRDRVHMTFQESLGGAKDIIYVRSAYRHNSFHSSSRIEKQYDLTFDKDAPSSSSALDNRLRDNYNYLMSSFMQDVYNKDLSGKEWVSQHIDDLNVVLSNVLKVKIVGLGNPLEDSGSLLFEKGCSSAMPFNNLSSGEKDVVDLIFDLYVKKTMGFLENRVVVIDEPDLRASSLIQERLLVEIERLLPDSCQLWVSVHSIGCMRALQADLLLKTQVIHLDEERHDFDTSVLLKPMGHSRKDWLSVLRVAIDNLASLVAPEMIIFCEGVINGLDEELFNIIFESKVNVQFIAATNKTELPKYAAVALQILNGAFDGVVIKRLVDRDDDQVARKCNGISQEIIKLERREFENYLYDFEVISSVFSNVDRAAYDKIVGNIVDDDVKADVDSLMSVCNFSGKDYEFKKCLASGVKESMNIYKQLSALMFT